VADEFNIPENKLTGVKVELTRGGLLVQALCPRCSNPVYLSLLDEEFEPGKVYVSNCTGVKHNHYKNPTFQLKARAVREKGGRNWIAEVFGTWTERWGTLSSIRLSDGTVISTY